jgi:hypothetical protein
MSRIRCTWHKILDHALSLATLSNFLKLPSTRFSIAPDTAALLPLAVLDPGPRACYHLIPGLRAHHRLIPDLISGPLLDLGFLASLTAPLLPTFSPQCRLLVRLCPEGLACDLWCLAWILWRTARNYLCYAFIDGSYLHFVICLDYCDPLVFALVGVE